MFETNIGNESGKKFSVGCTLILVAGRNSYKVWYHLLYGMHYIHIL